MRKNQLLNLMMNHIYERSDLASLNSINLSNLFRLRSERAVDEGCD